MAGKCNEEIPDLKMLGTEGWASKGGAMIIEDGKEVARAVFLE